MMNDRINTRMITMRVSEQEARQILSLVEYKTFSRGIERGYDLAGPTESSEYLLALLLG